MFSGALENRCQEAIRHLRYWDMLRYLTFKILGDRQRKKRGTRRRKTELIGSCAGLIPVKERGKNGKRMCMKSVKLQQNSKKI